MADGSISPPNAPPADAAPDDGAQPITAAELPQAFADNDDQNFRYKGVSDTTAFEVQHDGDNQYSIHFGVTNAKGDVDPAQIKGEVYGLDAEKAADFMNVLNKDGNDAERADLAQSLIDASKPAVSADASPTVSTQSTSAPGLSPLETNILVAGRAIEQAPLHLAEAAAKTAGVAKRKLETTQTKLKKQADTLEGLQKKASAAQQAEDAAPDSRKAKAQKNTNAANRRVAAHEEKMAPVQKEETTLKEKYKKTSRFSETINDLIQSDEHDPFLKKTLGRVLRLGEGLRVASWLYAGVSAFDVVHNGLKTYRTGIAKGESSAQAALDAKNQGWATTKDVAKTLGVGIAGEVIGGAIGGVIGGIVGSVIPVVGTAAGATAGAFAGKMIGGLIGGYYGKTACDWTYDHASALFTDIIAPAGAATAGLVAGDNTKPALDALKAGPPAWAATVKQAIHKGDPSPAPVNAPVVAPPPLSREEQIAKIRADTKAAIADILSPDNPASAASNTPAAPDTVPASNAQTNRGRGSLKVQAAAADTDGNVHFALNSAQLRPEDISALKSLAEDYLTAKSKYPNLKLEVYGHTDITGSDGYNLKLSQWRADIAKQYLINNYKGQINADDITAIGKGKGGSAPESRNDTFQLTLAGAPVERKATPQEKAVRAPVSYNPHGLNGQP